MYMREMTNALNHVFYDTIHIHDTLIQRVLVRRASTTLSLPRRKP